MTPGQEMVVSIILSVIGIVFIPLLITLIRVTVKWTKVEAKLDELARDMRDLVESKDKVHTDMIRSMSEDRDATNRRLRWLEEHIWRNSRNAL